MDTGQIILFQTGHHVGRDASTTASASPRMATKPNTRTATPVPNFNRGHANMATKPQYLPRTTSRMALRTRGRRTTGAPTDPYRLHA